MSKRESRVVFLIGAGRSGTTLLYKMLSIHQSVSYLSNYHKRYPNWPSLAYLQYILNRFPAYKRQSWFKDQGNAYFNERRKWLHSIAPTPSEAESVYTSCDIPLTPPDDYYLQPQVAPKPNNIINITIPASSKRPLLATKMSEPEDNANVRAEVLALAFLIVVTA